MMNDDYTKLMINASGPEFIVHAINSLVPLIPKEHRTAFNSIKLNLLSQFGESGLFERCNGRSIEWIFRNYGGFPLNQIVTSGTLEGKTFVLHDTPKQTDKKTD